ncbi:hypothetical protein [Halopenitus sp. H-Gu1]|uniref:capsular polysaccharide export protein, LipB/KpsS family n=1 Tax=Halopenitus sp. H-Gu1 TaxID=3242697 RepID=UPI00359F9605
MDEQISSYERPSEDNKGTILLPVTEGGNIFNSFTFSVLGHGFRTRGYEPKFVVCNNDLDLCIRKHRFPDDVSTCELCYHGATSTFDAFGIEQVLISDLSNGDEQNREFPSEGRNITHRDIEISDFAAASTRKFIQKFRIDFEKQPDCSIYRRFLSTAAHLVDIAYRLYEEHDPAAVLAHNPAYIYGGIYLEVAHQLDIPAYSLGTGWQDQRLLFGSPGNSSTLSQFEDQTFISEVLKTELSPEEETRTRDLMASRRGGSGTRIDYVGGADQSIKKQNNKTVIGMFTNLMWDASLEAGCPLFDDPYEWILSTIDYFADRPDVHLVVKVHPAEAVIGAERGVADEIDTAYDSLPGNVELLPPDTDVSPYELLEDLDTGIVWNSTIGLEMAYYGVPVIVAGETHYRGFDFTFDPDQVDGYYQLLNDIPNLETDDEMVARARRYVHYLFFQKSIPFPYIKTDDDSLGGHGLPVTHEEIADDPVLDLVVDRVIADKPVVLPRNLAKANHHVDPVV